jgi:hypothetical protein
VARENATLSVRNYERVLGVTKSCYLNYQHPVALIAILNASGSFFGVPLWARQQTFRSLLQTAMWPLLQLKDPYASFYQIGHQEFANATQVRTRIAFVVSQS